MADEIKTVILVIKSTTEGIDRAKAQLTELGATYTETERRVTQQTSSLEKYVASLNGGFRATQQYAAGQERLQRLVEAYTQKTGDAAGAQEFLSLGMAGLNQRLQEGTTRALARAESLDLDAIAAKKAAAANTELAASIAAANAEVTARNAQQAFNQQLGVKAPTVGAAATSAGVFVDAEKDAAQLEALKQKYDQLYAAQEAYKKQLAEIATLEKAAGGPTAALGATRDKVTASYTNQVRELDGTAAAERAATDADQAMAAAAQAVRDKLDPQAATARKVADETARLAAMVKATAITEEEGAAAAALYAKEIDGMSSAHGRATGVAGRLRESMVLFHEFLSGRWKQAIGSATIELQKFGMLGLLLNPITLAIIAVGAAVVATVAIMQRFAESQKELANAVRIGGDATGYTKDQLNALADATERTSHVTTSEARAIEATFASTGRIGGETLVQLTKMTGDFAASTGKNTKEAAGELAKLFVDPVKGAKQLDESYNLLDASQQRDIKNLAEQGRGEEARQKLIDALGPRLEHASEKVTALGKATQEAGKFFDHVLESIGRIGTAPGLDEQIAKAQAALNTANIKAGTATDPNANLFDQLTGLHTGVASGGPSASEAQSKLDALNAEKKAQEEKAAADQHAAQMRLDGNMADELAHKYDPLIDKKQSLVNAQLLLTKVIKDGNGEMAAEISTLAGVTSALDHLRTPLQEAQKKLEIDRQVAGASPAARPALRARLTEQDKAAQSTDPEISTNAAALGALAGQTAATGQVSAANDAANAEVRRATAEERLAAAAGKSTDAVRQATIANQVAEFAFTHGSVAVDKYRNALEQTTAAEQKREIAGTVLQLNQQADASERLAAAEQKGSAAAHQASIENQAFADALKVAGGDVVKFNAAYNQYLAALQRADVASGEAGIQKELRARQDSLAIAQLELSLTQRNVETRGEEVAALREKLKLQEQFPTATKEELDNLIQIAGAEGKLNAQIKENDQAEKDYRTVAKGVLTDITTAITDWANGTRSFKTALTDLSNQLLKMAQDQFIINPLKQMFDKQIGQGGLLGQGSGLANLFGAGSGIAGQKDYTAPIGPTMGTGDPMPSELLPSGGGIGGWFSNLFSGSSGGSGSGAANDNSMIKAGTDLTNAATKLGSDAASKLSGAASSLGGVKDLLGSTTTASMNVQATTVNVAGGGGGTPSLGGLGSLFGGSSPSTPSGVDGVTASTYSSGVSDAAVNLADGYALGGIFSSGNVIPFANGGAFQGSGVYSSPSYFPMASGRTGMLGEAGPEAVMPLVRGPSGSLGVKAHGGGGSPTPQVINSGSTINNEQHFHGDMSQEGMNRARRTSSQMSRDTLEQAQRKALRFGS